MVLVYLRPAQDRLRRTAEVEHHNLVEAVRLGTVFAHNVRAFRSWSAKHRRVARRRSLSDAQLERAVTQLGAIFPGTVERVVA